ncbi:MAG: phosphopyruvate hydratase [Actinomycetes bacterium]
MALTITAADAVEILDSRARPTLWVTLTLADGSMVETGVPAGASTGGGEAVELRDHDPQRFGGQGVLGAVAAVRGEIAELLVGRTWPSQAEVDDALCALDGTDDKHRLGANAIVGVSMAAARGFAHQAGLPLYRSLATLPLLDGVAPRIPVPHFNVVNGGAHAQNALAFQEFMIAPVGAPSIAEAVRAGAEVYAALRARLHAAGMPTGLGDEGGFAPDLTEPEDACALLVDAIESAGYRPGPDGVMLAMDPAANGFHDAQGYSVGGRRLSSSEMVDRYQGMVERFPIRLLEDGVAEDDDAGWRELTARLGGRIELVGDDNFTTNPAVIRQGIADGIANAALIKVNQIGTVTQTLEALAVCRQGGYGAFVSHRSGETPDDFIADLAVASGCGQLKTGAPARGERVAKYNRLVLISHRDPQIPYGLTR